MKWLLVLLAVCCVSGCASRRFCTGPMVPINRPAAARRPGRTRRASRS